MKVIQLRPGDIVVNTCWNTGKLVIAVQTWSSWSEFRITWMKLWDSSSVYHSCTICDSTFTLNGMN